MKLGQAWCAFALVSGMSAAMAIVVACSGGEGSPPATAPDGAPLPPGAPGAPPAAAPIPREQLEEKVFEAACESLENCCRLEGLEYVPGACLSALKDRVDGGPVIAFLIPPLTDTSVTYDPQAAGDCVEYYRTVFRAYNAACAEPAPLLEPGQTNGEFVLARTLGMFKKQNALPNALACTKMFVGSKAPGTTCTYGWECAPPARVPATGFSAPSCRKVGDADEKVCATIELVGENEACSTESDAVELRTCAPAELADPAAQLALDPKTLYERVRSLHCDAETKTCKARVQVADGESCESRGTYCDESRSFCRSSDKTCQPKLADGGDCGRDEDCTSDFCNDERKCEARKPAGAACSDDEECQTNRCSRNTKTCGSWYGVAANPGVCAGRAQ